MLCPVLVSPTLLGSAFLRFVVGIDVTDDTCAAPPQPPLHDLQFAQQVECAAFIRIQRIELLVLEAEIIFGGICLRGFEQTFEDLQISDPVLAAHEGVCGDKLLAAFSPVAIVLQDTEQRADRFAVQHSDPAALCRKACSASR